MPKAEIVANGYNLNIPRYVDSADAPEKWDIYASIHGGIPKAELAQFAPYWQAFDGLQESLFTDNGTPYVSPVSGSLKTEIQAHPSVAAYLAQYAQTFADLPQILENTLIAPMATLNISQTQQALAEIIRQKLAATPLIDFYTAYQKLDDLWRADAAGIAADLEMIQTEGASAIKQIDPVMVLKKDPKTKKEAEVQDGWVGHILPFELVQAVKLPQELANLKAKETRLAEITTEMQSILENLSEEEKACPAVNEEGDGFINAEIPKALQPELAADGIAIVKKADLSKAIDKHLFAEESLGAKLQAAYKLLAEEKTLKTELKTQSAELHSKTKAAIEALDDAEALDLLRQKWFVPLNAAMSRLPENMLAQFSQQLTVLCDKYADTYQHISERKQESAAALAQMMDELTGSEFDLQGIAAWQAILKG